VVNTLLAQARSDEKPSRRPPLGFGWLAIARVVAGFGELGRKGSLRRGEPMRERALGDEAARLKW
jgi:hypothetical protein